MAEYAPILIYLFAVIGFAAVSLLGPHIVAPRKRTLVKEMPYESGMDPIGDARKPFDVKFYLIAILFLVFDIEMLFIYPWAVGLRWNNVIEPENRLYVMGVMLSLLATLFLAYTVAWRKGVFQWRHK